MEPDVVPGAPQLSLIVPCYNEEEVIGHTLPRLAEAFADAGILLEMVAVDNGSSDRTGAILQDLALRIPSIHPHRVPTNRGYGYGVLQGIPHAHAPWLGIIPCDGQVDPEDVVRLFQAVAATNGKVLGKVRRRFRMDGLSRKVVSVTYNLFVRLLWPRLQSIDINGSPKILPRDVALAMDLQSHDWLLDPEIMIKAHYAGLRVLELNVFARMRSGGRSHVTGGTAFLFARQLVRSRLGGQWHGSHPKPVSSGAAESPRGPRSESPAP